MFAGQLKHFLYKLLFVSAFKKISPKLCKVVEIKNSIMYEGRYLPFATVQGRAKQSCLTWRSRLENHNTTPPPCHMFLYNLELFNTMPNIPYNVVELAIYECYHCIPGEILSHFDIRQSSEVMQNHANHAKPISI